MPHEDRRIIREKKRNPAVDLLTNEREDDIPDLIWAGIFEQVAESN